MAPHPTLHGTGKSTIETVMFPPPLCSIESTLIFSRKDDVYEEKKDRNYCLCGAVGADPAVLSLPVRHS